MIFHQVAHFQTVAFKPTLVRYRYRLSKCSRHIFIAIKVVDIDYKQSHLAFPKLNQLLARADLTWESERSIAWAQML